MPYLAVLAAGGPLWLVAVLALVVGARGALHLTWQSTTIHQRIPDAERSWVAAWSQLGNLVLLPASLAAAGPVAAALGPYPVLVVGAAWLAGSTVLVMSTHAVRAVGDEQASPTPEGRVREAWAG